MTPELGAPDYAAGASGPSLAIVDSAIMLAATAGDLERRNALMAMRAEIALAEILDRLTAMRGQPTPTHVANGGDQSTQAERL